MTTRRGLDMAEIPDSDSPDPLSSTPLDFVATPTASLPSSEAYLDDIDSLPSDSTQSYVEEPRQIHGRIFAHSSSSASDSTSDITSSLMSSSDNGDFPEYIDPSYSGESQVDSDDAPMDSFHISVLRDTNQLFDPFEPEESLFVDDQHNEDDNIDLVGPQHATSPDSWLGDSEDGHPVDNYLRAVMMDGFQQLEDLGDELVGMEVQPTGNPRAQRQRQQQSQGQPEVIDLTGDNDSPIRPPPQSRSRNARRRRSQQRSTPPRLARSDTGYMGSHTVIDLVSDSDDEPTMMLPPRRSNPPRNANQDGPPPRLINTLPPTQPDILPGRNALHQIQQLIHNIPLFRLLNHQQAMASNHDDDLVMLGQRHVMPNTLPQADLAPVNLDYIAHPFANPPPVPGGSNSKPPHDPPKETRPGFTRNTGEDVVAICPSCDEELAYDPEEEPPAPARKARTKKDKAEHHFWAVKACGHVYCRKCFENRKPVGKNPVPVGFRPDTSGPKNKVLCAVEDCDSDVSAKSAWVGIFL